MLDWNSTVARRRAQESAQAVEPTVYDAPPNEPDIYGEEQYPPGFGPNARPPDREFAHFMVSAAQNSPQKVECTWSHPEYFIISLDDTAGQRLGVYPNDTITGRPLALMGPKGHAKIPLNEKQRVLYLIALTATTCVGMCAFTRGCEYENYF